MNILLSILANKIFTKEYWGELLDVIVKWFLSFGKNLLIAILVLFVGRKIVKWILKFIKKSFEKTQIEPTVAKFVQSIVKFALHIILIIIIVGILGIPASSFIAVLSTAGLTIGLALQGSLSNFAGGVLILLFKPFKIGDYIKEDSNGNVGTVTGIDLFYTKLLTIDNRTVIVPNGMLANSSMTNNTAQKKRRLVINIGISYSDDIKLAKETLEEVIMAEEAVIKDDDINVYVDMLDASQVTIGTRMWVPTEVYAKTKWSLTEKFKYALDEKGIEIPFNQLTVNINK